MTGLPKVLENYTGTLEFPIPNSEKKIKISCAVLDNGTRVLVERNVANALGIKGAGAYWEKKRIGDLEILVPEYISAKYLQPYISDELKAKLAEPLKYELKNGKSAFGREASILPDICDVWIKYAHKEANSLTEKQHKISENAYILMKGFANIGIIALVDEATGYQEVRDRKALQEILDRYLAKEQAKWAKRFPDSFYREMFRLNNWQYNPMTTKRPSLIGKYTNNIIYQRLAPGVLQELKRLNPKDEKGNRKSKHHQWLTYDFGHPKLQEHLSGVEALMRATANWSNFMRMIERAYPKLGHTIPLNFNDEIE